METTLVINPGSASKKYALYRGGIEVLEVQFEQEGDGFGRCVEIDRTRKTCEEVSQIKYTDALKEVLAIAEKERVIESPKDITRVGVRIVAPGTFFAKNRVIDFAYVTKLKETVHKAPLHIPPLLHEIEEARALLPKARCIGVSDSAFHNTKELSALWYSLPKQLAKEKDIYRFGYHGLSVASAVRQIGEQKSPLPERIVVAHVGSGVSVTAVKRGKSVDTTMGFAPTSGLMMSSRAGEVDPSALIELMRSIKDPEALERLVSEESGFKGILGTSDLRIVIDRKQRGEKDAETAFQMFTVGIRKAIGAMCTVLGGIDVLVLTGTAAERNPLVRTHLTTNLEYLGLRIDQKANDHLGEKAGVFSHKDSLVVARVLHTNEMDEIAKVARIL